MIIAMVLGFVMMGTGLFLMSSEKRWPGAEVIGGCIGFLGFACFFLVFFDRPLLRLLMGERGTRLKSQSGAMPLLSAEISSEISATKISIDSDDYALLFADKPGGRLLIEGLSCRYQILASNVEAIMPFEFANYLGVQILYRIGPNVKLQIVVARVSIVMTFIQQAPLLFFLRRFATNRLFTRVAEALASGDAFVAN